MNLLFPYYIVPGDERDSTKEEMRRFARFVTISTI